MKFLQHSLLVAVLFFGVSVTPASADTIVEFASGDDRFSTLVELVVAQDLVDTLNSDGPFTVFAPTNDAFAALPGYVTNVITKNPDVVKDILLYHVVGEELFATDVVAEKRIKSVGGENLRVSTEDDRVFINQSEVIIPNVDVDNGVIHAVDRVLIPNKVYQAVIDNIREEIKMLREAIHDVRSDRRADLSAKY